MLVLFLFCTVIWKAVNFKRSKSFGDLAKRSLGLNILKSETKRQMTITYLNLLITIKGINCQMSSNSGYIVHFALELLAWSALKIHI